MSVLGAAAFLALLGGTLVAQEAKPGASAPPQQGLPQQGEQLLTRLSKEFSELRKSSHYSVHIFGDRKLKEMGLHLGNGLIAAPFCKGGKVGERVSVSVGKSFYRGTIIGALPPVASFVQLRDIAHVKDPPAAARYFADADRGALGELVMVLDTRRARLSFLHEQRFRTRSIPLTSAKQVDPKRVKTPAPPKDIEEARAREQRRDRLRMLVLAYGLADTESRAGACVVATDKSLVGMLVRPDWSLGRRARKTSPSGAAAKSGSLSSPKGEAKSKQAKSGQKGEGGAASRSRSTGGYAMVLDAKLLRELADKYARSMDYSKLEPSLGVGLYPYARIRASQLRVNGSASKPSTAPKKDGENGEPAKGKLAKGTAKTVEAPQLPGLYVTRVYEGGPAARAGVEAHDRWLALDGKELTGLQQVKDALARLRPGQKMLVRYLRAGKVAQLSIEPD